MQIDLLSIDELFFTVKEYDLNGEKVFLVNPKHLGIPWSKDNLIFRSSVWSSNGEPVSLSFKKFFNWGERTDLGYTPFSVSANGGCQFVEKIDGSTLCVSHYKGQLIARTRGTLDATQLDNGYEIASLKERYPLAFSYTSQHGNLSLIFEWVSPVNKIVIDYPEPDIYLTGVINHSDYSLWAQKDLDALAIQFGVKRPPTYYFKSIKEMLNNVSLFSGKEGVCVYCNRGQDIRKVKSEWYCKLHSFKSDMASIENVIDYFFAHGCPDY